MTSVERRIGIAIVGTGRSGLETIRACLAQPDMTLAGVVSGSASRHGRDAGELVGERRLGVPVTPRLEDVLGDDAVDVVVYCGMGDNAAVAEVLARCVDAGKDAVTITGLVHPATALGHGPARALHERARAGGARIVGSGSNPGFLLDVMPVIFGGLYDRIDGVRARRFSELKEWGTGILDELGIGRPPFDPDESAPLRVRESMHVIADGLRIELDEVVETNSAIITTMPRSAFGRSVEAGATCGFSRRIEGRMAGRTVVDVEWIGLFCMDTGIDGCAEGTELELGGPMRTTVTVRMVGDDYPAASARLIHSVRGLRMLEPGLYRPDQLPLNP